MYQVQKYPFSTIFITERACITVLISENFEDVLAYITGRKIEKQKGPPKGKCHWPDPSNPPPTPALATMRIAHLLHTHLAVLVLAAVSTLAFSYESLNETVLTRTKRNSRHSPLWIEEYLYTHEQPLKDAGTFLTPRENQVLLRHETKNRSGVDCCPSVQEMVEPEGGMNQDDQYVELYRDGENRQRFYELSCHKDIVGKPCRFMDRKLHNQSRCVQKYSYTYALVKDPGGGSRGGHLSSHPRPSHFPSFPSSEPGGPTWTLDYIRVRSGCSCVVTPNVKKRRSQKSRKRARHEPSGD